MTTKQRSKLIKHLQACDSWMRELSSYLWHRRANTVIAAQRESLVKDIKAGEKLIVSLQVEDGQQAKKGKPAKPKDGRVVRLSKKLERENTLEDLRFIRDVATAQDDTVTALACAIAIDKKRGLYK